MKGLSGVTSTSFAENLGHSQAFAAFKGNVAVSMNNVMNNSNGRPIGMRCLQFFCSCCFIKLIPIVVFLFSRVLV